MSALCIWMTSLCTGGSFQTVLASLRRVLERVTAVGLKVHPEKCHFLRREVAFLGHKIGGEGISTLEAKVQAVRGWPTPSDARQLKSFFGLASYYRRFLRGFSCTADPLFCLLRKDREFVWTAECPLQLEQTTQLFSGLCPSRSQKGRFHSGSRNYRKGYSFTGIQGRCTSCSRRCSLLMPLQRRWVPLL